VNKFSEYIQFVMQFKNCFNMQMAVSLFNHSFAQSLYKNRTSVNETLSIN